ncbi:MULTISPECIES: hypothetical protein [unclassified Bradyrhizobium]|nr:MULTISPECIES: hypothetical protein [unclassified Bradyrhizobium]MCK1422660.1 hypothetical protein [Bradyrhizobium sp. CW12]MCK1644715.1 hypothetical protein [Bradyrhizobium sp. 154]
MNELTGLLSGLHREYRFTELGKHGPRACRRIIISAGRRHSALSHLPLPPYFSRRGDWNLVAPKRELGTIFPSPGPTSSAYSISGRRLTQIALMMLPAGKPQKEGNSRDPA